MQRLIGARMLAASSSSTQKRERSFGHQICVIRPAISISGTKNCKEQRRGVVDVNREISY